MKPLLPLLLLLFASALPAFSQELPARLLMANQQVLSVSLRPRAPGTSSVQATRLDGETPGLLQSISLSDVQRIHFDLSALRPDTVAHLYYLGRYEDVVNALKGRVIPYFAYVDQDANSNELVEFFIRSLYMTGNDEGVRLSYDEVLKYALKPGPVRRVATLFLALSHIRTGNAEGLEQVKSVLLDPDPSDPLASAIWYAQAKLALASNHWAAAHPPLAKIITETPLDTEWVGEALYLTAQHHHSRTNRVVAHQICQEIQLVAPTGPWAERAAELQRTLVREAEAANVPLAALREPRPRENEPGDARIDYRERQRALEEESRRLRQEQRNDPP